MQSSDSAVNGTLRCALYSTAMERLNQDCIAALLDHTNVGQLNSTIACIRAKCNGGQTDLAELKRNRLSPVKAFSRLVGNPGDLMREMLATGAALSGSRAADYFVPGSCVDASDWDFYVRGDPESSESAAFRRFMEKSGVLWDAGDVPDASSCAYCPFGTLSGTMQRGPSSGVRVQLMHVGNSVLSAILSFHSTTPQCFMSGFAAGHMYYRVASRGAYVEWESNSKESMARQAATAKWRCAPCGALRRMDARAYDRLRRQLNRLKKEFVDALCTKQETRERMVRAVARHSSDSPVPLPYLSSDIADALVEECKCVPVDGSVEALLKYSRRGYEKLSFRSYMQSTKAWSEVGLTNEKGVVDLDTFYRSRYMGDDDSIVIPFVSYMQGASQTDGLRALSVLRNFMWLEYNYGTLPIGQQYKIRREVVLGGL